MSKLPWTAEVSHALILAPGWLLASPFRRDRGLPPPTCATSLRPGALTTQWRQATQEAVAKLHQEAKAAESAERAAADARQRTAALPQPVPPVLLAGPPLPGVDTGPARAAWQRWAAPPDAGSAPGRGGLRALADYLG